MARRLSGVANHGLVNHGEVLIPTECLSSKHLLPKQFSRCCIINQNEFLLWSTHPLLQLPNSLVLKETHLSSPSGSFSAWSFVNLILFFTWHLWTNPLSPHSISYISWCHGTFGWRGNSLPYIADHNASRSSPWTLNMISSVHYGWKSIGWAPYNSPPLVTFYW